MSIELHRPRGLPRHRRRGHGPGRQRARTGRQVDLAESALHAPAAGFGETGFYPDFIEKAAVLVVRLAKNHPLPDGNKRAAWVALRLFIEINNWSWQTAPAVDDAEQAVLAIAAGMWNQDDVAAWLHSHLMAPQVR